MPKALSVAALVVAVIILLIFGIDLAAQFPFGRVSIVMDITMVGAAAVLGVMSWITFREQV